MKFITEAIRAIGNLPELVYFAEAIARLVRRVATSRGLSEKQVKRIEERVFFLIILLNVFREAVLTFIAAIR